MSAPRRIAILGGAGAGKSTLARRIGEAFDLPVIHLDRLKFGPGWTPVEPTVFHQRVAAAVKTGAWVMDGTYPPAGALALPRADLVIWLDQPAWRRLWRSWRKTRAHRGRPRGDRPDGCEEAFGWTYAWQVLRFGGWSERLRAQLERAGARSVVRLRGDRAARGLLADLTRGARNDAKA